MAEHDTQTTAKHIGDPEEIAKRGESIYESKFRAQFEKEHMGWFAAIDVRSERGFVASHPEEALKEARQAEPSGVFHLIRIGAPGAFRVSYTSHGRKNWLLQKRVSGD